MLVNAQGARDELRMEVTYAEARVLASHRSYEAARVDARAAYNSLTKRDEAARVDGRAA
jgi:hypothetical protein